MNSLMGKKICCLTDALSTLRAFIAFLLCVNSLMPNKFWHFTEPLSTFWTFKVFLSCINTLVWSKAVTLIASFHFLRFSFNCNFMEVIALSSTEYIPLICPHVSLPSRLFVLLVFCLFQQHDTQFSVTLTLPSITWQNNEKRGAGERLGLFPYGTLSPQWATKLERSFSGLPNHVVVYSSPLGIFPAARVLQMNVLCPQSFISKAQQSCTWEGGGSAYFVGIPFPTAVTSSTIFLAPAFTSTSLLCSLCFLIPLRNIVF